MPMIQDDRPLSPEEAALTRWLLEHGSPEALRYLADLPHARVVGHCPCGCASVDFAIADRKPPPGTGLETLGDYVWRDAEGRLAGIFVFACAGQLAGLELYTLDPDAAIDRLPAPETLVPVRGGDVP